MLRNSIAKIRIAKQKLSSWKNHLLNYDYKHFYEQVSIQSQFYYKDIRFKLKSLDATNYELALFHYNNGNLKDAKFRFWFYSRFWPGKPEVDYFLGRINFELGEPVKSIEYLRCYMDSGNEAYKLECEYTMHAALSEDNKIKSIPLSLLRHKFDIGAEQYNKFALENLATLPHNELCVALNAYLNEIGRPYGNRMLDLGSGTGVIGVLMHMSKSLGFATGVDISVNSCKIAVMQKIEDKPVYNQVLNIDINEFFQLSSGVGHNLIVMGDLLNYCSDAGEVLQQVTKISDSETVLALMFRTNSEGGGSCYIMSDEEFLHSADAVSAILEDASWNIVKNEVIEYKEGIPGWWCICRLKQQ